MNADTSFGDTVRHQTFISQALSNTIRSMKLKLNNRPRSSGDSNPAQSSNSHVHATLFPANSSYFVYFRFKCRELRFPLWITKRYLSILNCKQYNQREIKLANYVGQRATFLTSSYQMSQSQSLGNAKMHDRESTSKYLSSFHGVNLKVTIYLS